MTIFNLGSINADMFYAVPHLPGAGETLAATSHFTGLGGKGANMSVAAARAGAEVVHIGAVGSDGNWAVDRLAADGINIGGIAQSDDPTGHAIITVDAQGENAIVLFPGANTTLSKNTVRDALSTARTGDLFVSQNETNLQAFSAEIGSKMGLRIAYAAAPFDADAVQAVLPYLDLLILNEVEANQLSAALGVAVDDLPIEDIVVTLGAKGCRWKNRTAGHTEFIPAPAVNAVDTTGAGDTFTGYLLAGIDTGLPMQQALTRATKAAALMVTRHGTADVIPKLSEL